jgi:hypothetical protein
MISRDHWAENFFCRTCEATGEAEFSRASGGEYFDSDPGISVERVPSGFKVVPCQYGSNLYCATCDSPVEEKPWGL